MKTECIREVVDIILDPAETSEEKMKLELQGRGIDAERWRGRVLCRLRQKREQGKPVEKGEMQGRKDGQ